MEFICAHCGKKGDRLTGDVNRAIKANRPLYCDKKCAGLGRRKNKTPEQLKEEKRLYDLEYRAKNKEMLKAKKAVYFQATYDPEKAAIERKAKMPRHIEYCRQPEYMQKKKIYDRLYRVKKCFGEFWESALLIMDIDKEVSARMTDVEIRKIKGTLNLHIQRRRQYERERNQHINCN